MSGEFRIQVLGNVRLKRAEAEILAEAKNDPVAIVWESSDGWRVEFTAGDFPLESILEAIAEAKTTLRRYVNRRGHDAPPGLSPAGFSLWLMMKDDGTALGRRP